MAGYTYVLPTGSLKRFFAHIQTAGIPPKVTVSYLQECGFKGTNDKPIIKVLKSLGFIGSDGVPTNDWQKYRDKGSAPYVLAYAIRRTYGDLFNTYPDAHIKDDDVLSNFFSTRTTGGGRVISATTATFKTLCSMANFKEDLLKVPDMTEEKAPVEEKQKVAAGLPSTERFTLNINIQLQLPSTDDPKIYENLFAALKKHLFSSEA